MALNFLHLATTWENLGAKGLLGKNFAPCRDAEKKKRD